MFVPCMRIEYIQLFVLSCPPACSPSAARWSHVTCAGAAKFSAKLCQLHKVNAAACTRARDASRIVRCVCGHDAAVQIYICLHTHNVLVRTCNTICYTLVVELVFSRGLCEYYAKACRVTTGDRTECPTHATHARNALN